MAQERDERGRFVSQFSAEGAEGVGKAFASISGAAGGLGGALSSLGRIAGPVSGILATLGGALTAHKLLEVSGAYEQVQARMAGTLSALGFADDFAEGLQAASGVMDSIYAAAAKLPGEAEDYIEVYTQGLPVVQAAIGGTAEEIADFTNRYTAVAKSLQIDTFQAANDLQRLLQSGRGGAGVDVKTFQRLVPFMRQVEGYADLTTASFNALSETARADLLGKAVAKMGPTVEAMSESWDAVKGAVATAGRDLLRVGGAPLFASAKKSMSALANSILDSKGRLTEFGQTVANVGQWITGHIGKALEMVTNRAQRFAESLTGGLRRVADSPFVAKLDALFEGAKGLVAKIPSNAGASGAGKAIGAGGGALAATALVGALPFGGLINMVAGPLVAAIGAAAGQSLGGVIDSIGLTDAVVRVTDGLSEIAGSFSWVVDAAGYIATSVYDTFKALLPFAQEAFGNLWTAIVGFFEPVGQLLGGFADLFLHLLLPNLKYLGYAALSVVDAFTTVIKWVTDKLHLAVQVYGLDKRKSADFPGAGKAGGEFSDWLKRMTEMPRQVSQAVAKGAKGPSTPKSRASSNIVQDLRGSRFDIQQNFDKNFDPDRVAVAFSKDLERVGRKKLQSGFEPLFGVS